MRKFAMSTIAVATLLLGGLTGCGTDNQSGDMGGGTFRGASTGTEQYPTTERRGMTGARYTGEGPITDMFSDDDRVGRRSDNIGVRRNGAMDGSRLRSQNRQGMTGQNNSGYINQDRQGMRGQGNNDLFNQNNIGFRNNDNGLFESNNGQGLDFTNGQYTNQGERNRNNQNIDEQKIERTVKNMENVDNCNVVSHGDSVVIAVETNGNNRNDIENQIKEKVKQHVQGKNVYVVTDKEQVNQVRTMGERMRNGGTEAINEVGDTINDMINDLGRAASRPFENSR